MNKEVEVIAPNVNISNNTNESTIHIVISVSHPDIAERHRAALTALQSVAQTLAEVHCAKCSGSNFADFLLNMIKEAKAESAAEEKDNGKPAPNEDEENK